MMRGCLILLAVLGANAGGSIIAPPSFPTKSPDERVLYSVKDNIAYQGQCSDGIDPSFENCQKNLLQMPADNLSVLLLQETQVRLDTAVKALKQFRKELPDKRKAIDNEARKRLKHLTDFTLEAHKRALEVELGAALWRHEQSVAHLDELQNSEKKILGGLAEGAALRIRAPLERLVMLKVAKVFRAVLLQMDEGFPYTFIYPRPIKPENRERACSEYHSEARPMYGERLPSNGYQRNIAIDSQFVSVERALRNAIKEHSEELSRFLAYKTWPADWIHLATVGYSNRGDQIYYHHVPFYSAVDRWLWNVRTNEMRLVRYLPQVPSSSLSPDFIDFDDKGYMYVPQSRPPAEMAVCSFPRFKVHRTSRGFPDHVTPWTFPDWQEKLVIGMMELHEPLPGDAKVRVTYFERKLDAQL